jgi:hypothetical protein
MILKSIQKIPKIPKIPKIKFIPIIPYTDENFYKLIKKLNINLITLTMKQKDEVPEPKKIIKCD